MVLPTGIVVLGFVAIYAASAAAGSDSETYKQNAKGLEKQFESFLKAYSKGCGGTGPGFHRVSVPRWYDVDNTAGLRMWNNSCGTARWKEKEIA